MNIYPAFILSALTLAATLAPPNFLIAQQSYEPKGGLSEHIKPTLSPARSPEEALASFELVDGFEIELVAAEPLIEDPVIIDFDTQGRMWVVEMRGFMMDINATGQFDKVGRVSVLEDTNGDGIMDKSTRFLNDLILPRALRCFQDGILVAEHEALWYVTDANNDLVPDEKILIDPEYATHGSVEHRPNGLLIGLDNWIYNSRSSKRYKLIDGEWIIEATENRGQWGITQDDYGRLYYNFHWSQLHTDIAPPNTLTRNPNFTPTLSANSTVSADQLVYPIRMNTAINRGYREGVLDDEGKLKRFASACSPWIYRGGIFPETFDGNAFVCAPAANTIKRNLISDHGLTVSGINAYADHDFLASTDERFRPVSLSGGPDGALYVVDMYRGIIQQADFMTEFLRKESIDRELAAPINLGRIYRIKPTQADTASLPDFSSLTTNDWVDLLQHPNGWVRDRAQQWLLWKRPSDAAEPLKKLARDGTAVSSLHALWCLDGMGMDPFSSSIGLIAHSNQKLASTAMVIAARSANTRERIQKLVTIFDDYFDTSVGHAFHSVIAVGIFDYHSKSALFTKIAVQFNDSPNIREALLSCLRGNEFEFLKHLTHSTDWTEPTPGRQLLIQGLASCAIRHNKLTEVRSLLESSKQAGWKGKAMTEGLITALLERKDPLELDSNPALKDSRFDSLLAWPGHEGPKRSKNTARPLTPNERALYVKGHTIYSGLCASCHGAEGSGMPMLAPPLVNSEWVTGDPDRLARILLHGLEGSIQVAGKTYAPPQILPAMPPVGMMSNEELAATMTYIRRAWDHQADPVTGGDIQRNRDLTATQEGAYSTSDW